MVQPSMLLVRDRIAKHAPVNVPSASNFMCFKHPHRTVAMQIGTRKRAPDRRLRLTAVYPLTWLAENSRRARAT